MYTTIRSRLRVLTDLFLWFGHDHSTKKIWSSFTYFFFSARPFDQNLGSSLIYFFYLCTTIQPKIRILINFFYAWSFDQDLGSSLVYCFFDERSSDQNLNSPLIYFFHLHTKIRQKYNIFFHLFFLSAQPFDQKLGSSLIYCFYLYTTYRSNLVVILAL